MAYLNLAQVSIVQGTKHVTVGGVEQLTDLIRGDILYIAGELPEQIAEIDVKQRILTLTDSWGSNSVDKVKARIVPSSADFRASARRLRSLNTLASQAVGYMDALANKNTSITITLPDETQVTVPSIPKVIQDATAAGTSLKQKAQQAIDLMGNAPALAKSVADNKELVLRFINETEGTEVQPGKYSMAHYLSKVTQQQVAAQQAKTATEQLKSEVMQLKAETNTLKDTSSNQASLASASAALAEKFANHPVDSAVQSGKFSALHYMNKSESAKTAAEKAKADTQQLQSAVTQLKQQTQVLRNQSETFRNEQRQIAGGDAPNALKLGGKSAQQWQDELRRIRNLALAGI